MRMAPGTQCAGFMPGSEPYQRQIPIAGRGDGQAQLRAAGMPRAEPGWGSPPRGSAPRGPCSPAGSVGEYNIAVLICALQEGDTGMLLPVSHGLPEDCPLAACGRKSRAVILSSEWGLGALSPTDTVLQPICRHTGRPGGCRLAKCNKTKARCRLTVVTLTSEIPSNNKRDDPIGPHPLWSGCRCPPAPRPASPSAPAFPLRLPTSALTTQGRRVSCSFDG